MRTKTFTKTHALVAALRNIGKITRFLGLQLVEKGFLKIETVQNGGRGRPRHRFVLSGKARGLLALAANWGKRLENLKQFFKAEPITVEA